MSARPSRDRRRRGFTLVELLTVMALLSALLLVAVPSIIDFRRSSELNAATNTLLVALHGARGEAMKRGLRAGLVPLRSDSWASGWRVFVDADQDGTLSAGDPVLAAEDIAAEGRLLVTGTGTAGDSGGKYLLFDASGYARTKDGTFVSSALVLQRTDSAEAGAGRIVKVSRTGRARSCRPDGPDCDSADE